MTKKTRKEIADSGKGTESTLANSELTRKTKGEKRQRNKSELDTADPTPSVTDKKTDRETPTLLRTGRVVEFTDAPENSNTESSDDLSAIKRLKSSRSLADNGQVTGKGADIIKKVKQDRKTSNAEIQHLRRQLPVYLAKNSLISSINENSIVIIVGETGSGKTTQLPQFLHEAGYTKNGIIAVTQPRRVAAISIATRVSQEMQTKVGETVGYAIRFEDVTSPNTKIKYLTDGMLLRELLTDSNLTKYSVIILDEAHERTLRTDVLFGTVKGILKRRPNLKIVIMSATLNAVAFSAYFNNAKIINVPGRQFPVQTFYASEKQEDYVDAALVAILQISKEQPAGDILVFLTGQEEIENLEKLVNEQAKTLPADSLKILVCPIFASQPTGQQTKVFDPAPPGVRKVVLSTNVAETSITISGIRYVIDTGMVKMRAYNPKSGIESLSVQPISQASAGQRAGRAGREAAGVCYRLYTEAAFKTLSKETEPEIMRCNLANVLLLLKASGISDVVNFDFMDKPTRSALVGALETLYALGALDNKGDLTDMGRRMASFPLEPTLSKVLIQSEGFKCTSEAITIVAMLSIDPVFFSPHEKREEAMAAKNKFVSFDGDHITLLNTAKAYLAAKGDATWCADHFISSRSMRQIMDIRKQLIAFCEQQNIPPSVSCGTDYESVQKCLLSGFFRNIAIRQHDGSYKTLASRQTVHIHPSSVLFRSSTPSVMFSEWVHTSRMYLRNVSMVQVAWLGEVAGHYYGRNSLNTIKN
ncbi:hypothetical protein BASA81_005241 [Batrachochytrium salamandrivorans]|nr:hypothetical protein BASA62_010298 [Batrachochytrium salamandrivorans]KAH9256552.1 hypothetical protein BASA81_005241 [Batrachochytrium salamandrivorans]